jgi:hypothetical protein
MRTLSKEEVKSVGGGLDPTTGGLAILGMGLIPGINVGLAAFAVTTGLGFVIGSTWYRHLPR